MTSFPQFFKDFSMMYAIKRPLSIILFCITIPFTVFSNTHTTVADVLDVSEYFHDLCEEEDSNKLKKSFEQFLPKDFAASIYCETYKHFTQIVMYAKKHFVLSPNRYILLQKIVKKLTTLPSLISTNVEKMYELYTLADFTGTSIIADAVVLYFVKNSFLIPELHSGIFNDNGRTKESLEKRIEFMQNVDVQMSMSTDNYIDTGILPIITYNVHALHPYALASTLRDSAQDTLKTFKKNAKKSSRLNYLEQCLQLAPDQILHKKLPAFFKKDVEQLLANELTNTTKPNLDLFLGHYASKGMRNIALKVCYSYLQKQVTNQQTFKIIFDSLQDKTLKYFCRYLFYVNNHEFIDSLHSTRTWDYISNIQNQELDLSGCFEHINTYLPSILDLVMIIAPNLTTLYLNSTKLSTLPENIGNFVKLEKLNVNANQLTSLPKQLYTITNLKKLFLGYNKFTTISGQMSKLIKLEELYLTNNQLKRLPETIYDMICLKELSLADNQLVSISKKIGNLVNLTNFSVDNNQALTSLPTEIGNLVNLKELWVDREQLISIAGELEKLVNISELILNKNQFNHEERQEIENKLSSMFQVTFVR
jgi:hypothetical protein